MSKFSRSQPSPRYTELLTLYRQLHNEGDLEHDTPSKFTFSGVSVVEHAARIKTIIDRTHSETILDYGSGKGRYYSVPSITLADGTKENILDFWGVLSVDCYDPAYSPFSTLPTNRYDGVVAVDVLEHCPEEDIPWILEEVFSFARLFVYATVACFPASKSLPNGENAHCTIRPLKWWQEVLAPITSRHDEILYEIWFRYPQTAIANADFIDAPLRNFKS